MKRSLSLILVFALILSIGSVPISATGATEYSSRSTKEIILELMDTDVAISLLATNTTYEETYAHLRQFNPLLVELENRSDSASVMIEIIGEMQEANSSAVSCAMLGILLSQQVHFNKITTQDRANLCKLQATEELESTTVQAESNIPQARGWLEELITSLFPFAGYDDAAIDRYTLSGDRIPLQTSRYEYSDNQKNSYQSEILNEFPDLIVYGSPTKKYNCHSYAWYDESAQNQYWLSEIDVFLNDAHLTEIYYPVVGAICVYFDEYNTPLHSAVVKQVNGQYVTCVSKWGNMGLYVHERQYVPSAYKQNDDTLNTRFYIYPYSHTCTGPYNQSTDQYHTGTCTVCGTTVNIAHVSTVTRTSTTHTLTCRLCGWVKTQRHTYDAGGKCTVCNYQGGIIPMPND